MNRNQREKNRRTSRALARVVRAKVLEQHTCENCGEKGGHWVRTRPMSIEALFTGVDDSEGFWTCPKLYGEDGRRIVA